MLIEAMACGVPVLASRSGEIPHVLGDAGVLLPEDDVAGWAATLTRAIADAAMRRDLADRGLRRARTEFAWTVVARRHLEFFEELTKAVNVRVPRGSTGSTGSAGFSSTGFTGSDSAGFEVPGPDPGELEPMNPRTLRTLLNLNLRNQVNPRNPVEPVLEPGGTRGTRS